MVNYLDLCDSAEKCDEYLTRVMIQIEELESRFADFDEFVLQLSEKRAEIYAGFEARKQNLLEARNRRADTLMRSAERILKGIGSRAATMESINAINGYFASDLMIEKIRGIIEQLISLGDTVKADDIQGQLKTIREDTVRQFKDRSELYLDGENIIRFGEHRFSVNHQPLDLTIIRRDKEQFFHLTGTNFFELIDDEEFNQTKSVWEMTLPSENHQVCRAEFLAFQLLSEYERSDKEQRQLISKLDRDQLLTHIRKFSASRYAEGYAKGIHDSDAARIFSELIRIHHGVGLLRFPPRIRALAQLFWIIAGEAESQGLLLYKITSFGHLSKIFPSQQRQDNYIGQLAELIKAFQEESGLFREVDSNETATYLFYELSRGGHFVISREAHELRDSFEKVIRPGHAQEQFKQIRVELEQQPSAEYELGRDWLRGYCDNQQRQDLGAYLDEAAVLLFLRGRAGHSVQDMVEVAMSCSIEELISDHPTVKSGTYQLNYHGFIKKLSNFQGRVLPLYNSFQEQKKALSDKMRSQLRLDEFKPQILTSFVRNKLINRVYLPLIGDNLAKQIGVAGESKRTDLMGLLLLISPPGYGKTTLMEYLANRLGIIFMKINGPAIGNRVTSLDPVEAPFASAREELHKLNLALEMGDNIMLYLDDIQHCNPEFLQKFISLCDAQRKIEGVYKGRSRTYDFRGKKVVVVMAGNPFTESGEKFKIPDMLANRADTYNLGDIIGETGDDFKLSYLENCLTSNSILNQLATKSQQDVYTTIQIAETDNRDGVEFEGSYSSSAVDEMVAVMKKLIKVRDVILAVNGAYIYSAGQADAYRTEPPFLLQGSYRNMNRIAEKIVPIMNDAELDILLTSHYENESQTLTTGAEANLLKFKELTGQLSGKEEKRWLDIKKTFMKHQSFLGADSSDPVGRVVAQLAAFQESLGDIRDILSISVEKQGEPQGSSQLTLAEETLSQLGELLQNSVKTEPASPEEDQSTISEPRKVMDRIPKWYLQVLSKQFDIIDSWMSPTLDELSNQKTEYQKLTKQINSLKDALKIIISEKGNLDKLPEPKRRDHYT